MLSLGKGYEAGTEPWANIRREPGVISDYLWRLMIENTQRKQSHKNGITIKSEYESGSN